MPSTPAEEPPSVTLFREYIRIKSVQPTPDYDSCVSFFARIANDLNLPHVVTELAPGKPVVVITWEGLEPDLPSILLNSHTDVVPVFPESWKYDPFAAVKEENGDIYGRGTQDMKSVGIQHIEAVRRLKNEGKRFKRTIHLCFMPDEEGGGDGMGKFVLTQEFKRLNVGFGLDEGLASPDAAMQLYYGERVGLWLELLCKGNPGHGSMFIKDTAVEKVHFMMNKLLQLRKREEEKLDKNKDLTVADVSTVNITTMSGGVALNVIPEDVTIGVDIRVSPSSSAAQILTDLHQWIHEAEGNIELKLIYGSADQRAGGYVTSIAEDYPWFKAFKTATNKHNLKIEPRIFPAGTDNDSLRRLDIPAYGFSPMNNTPILLHDHNEYLNESVFLKGIDIMYDVVSEIASV